MTFNVMRNKKLVLDTPKRPMVKHHCCSCPATYATYAGQQPTCWTKVNGKLYCRSKKCRDAADAQKVFSTSKSSTVPESKIGAAPMEPAVPAQKAPIRPAPMGKPRPLYHERLQEQSGLSS